MAQVGDERGGVEPVAARQLQRPGVRGGGRDGDPPGDQNGHGHD
jgi:hypothetical protein